VEQYLGTDELPKNDLITYLQKNADAAFLRHWKLTGTNKSIRKNRNCSQLIAAYKVYIALKHWFEWNGFELCFSLKTEGLGHSSVIRVLTQHA
jgi:retron-type reverse transcriptase